MKRLFDFTFALLGLVLLAPIFLVVSTAIKIGDRGPIFYRQQRVGRDGALFRIWKFRTMRVGADKIGPAITKSGDARVTPVGRVLRKAKVDELPQLMNVISGEMSLVGPRPEVPKYVALYTREQRRVLDLKPGITDIASIEFRGEENLLASMDDPEKFYRDYCIPRKIELNLAYAQRASVAADVMVILRTIFAIGRRSMRGNESGVR